MNPFPLSVEEQRYQRDFFSTVLKWIGTAAFPLSLVFGAAFWRSHAWPALAAAGIFLLVSLVGAWGVRRVAQGQVLQASRVFLASCVVLTTTYLLVSEEALWVPGMMGFGLLIIVATSLGQPRASLRFAAAGIACYGLVVLLHSLGRLTPVDLGGFGRSVIRTVPVVEMVIFALVGQASTRHLRQALVSSEKGRQEVEQANAVLARQKADLQRIEAHLSGLAMKLDRSNQELQSFAYVVAHDLRAPLRALSNYSRFLQEDCAGHLDEACREYVGGISDSARHMDALVVALLDYARVGRDHAPPEAVDLGSVLERVVSGLRLREKGEVSLPVDLPRVRANPVRIEQIFSNLLSNAFKYQRPGVRPQVAVEWADRGAAWELSVRDNGIGIEAQHREKIFGIFQRLHRGEEYEGTGIGLAIVKKAVEEQGGTVWVESTPGQGSVFRFTVPKVESVPVG